MPQVLLYTVQGHDLNFAERLNPVTQRSADQVVEHICSEIRLAIRGEMRSLPDYG